MCGIAGYFGTATLSPERLEACRVLMRRRGPDHAGHTSFANSAGRKAYLLHSRLSIIDIGERANQPFEVGDLAAVYNGELYNYLELRQKLQLRGVQFRTQSDTEVLITAIAREGWNILDQCEGMWALAVYDTARGSLTLSRDRFGEKPLYIHQSEDGIYFGSEAKFIFALLGRKLPINKAQISRFLVNGYKSLYKGGETFFEGLSELPPSHNLFIDATGKTEQRPYWHPRFQPRDDMTYKQAVEGCREQLIDAVRLRLRSDVPMAFMMSGGVDSSAIISIAKRIFNYDVHGFTIMNDDVRYDEKPIVEASVAALGIRHTPLHLRPGNIMAGMRELVKYHDAPIYTITYYVQWLLMQEVAKAGYKVSFSGTGADELVSGYYDHHLMYLAEMQGKPGHDAALAAWTKHVKPEVRNPFLSNPDLFVGNWSFRDHIYLNNHIWADFLTHPFAEEFAETHYTDSLLRNRMMNEIFYEGVRVILHEDDLNAMYFSIENRSPYLDRNLFEFCYSIPNRHLIQDGFNKAVLRDSMRGIVPDQVLDQRRKIGFNTPILSLLDTQDAAVQHELLADSPVFDVIRRDRMPEILGKGDLHNSESKFLFNFLNTKLFLEEFSS